jgi:hypothetical protein
MDRQAASLTIRLAMTWGNPISSLSGVNSSDTAGEVDALTDPTGPIAACVDDVSDQSSV